MTALNKTIKSAIMRRVVQHTVQDKCVPLVHDIQVYNKAVVGRVKEKVTTPLQSEIIAVTKLEPMMNRSTSLSFRTRGKKPKRLELIYSAVTKNINFSNIYTSEEHPQSTGIGNYGVLNAALSPDSSFGISTWSGFINGSAFSFNASTAYSLELPALYDLNKILKVSDFKDLFDRQEELLERVQIIEDSLTTINKLILVCKTDTALIEKWPEGAAIINSVVASANHTLPAPVVRKATVALGLK